MSILPFDPKMIRSQLFHENNEHQLISGDVFARMDIDSLMGCFQHGLQIFQTTYRFRHDLRASAVLILLLESDQGWQMVLTERSHRLRHHPGQISFLGGMIEQGESTVDAALREANEEIGLNTKDVEVIGAMPHYQTMTGFDIAPIVAWMPQDMWKKQHIEISTDEVERMLVVAQKDLMSLENLRVHSLPLVPKSRRFLSTTIVYHHEELFIWGATMSMIKQFWEVLSLGYKKGWD